MSYWKWFFLNRADVEDVLLNPLRKPSTPIDLYRFCENVLVWCGKYPCVIISYIVYKTITKDKYKREKNSSYDMLALDAVEKRIEQPNEQNRKNAWRIASIFFDFSWWDNALDRISRGLVHMVGRRNRRQDSFRYNILGNHYFMSNHELLTIINIIEKTLWSMVLVDN